MFVDELRKNTDYSLEQKKEIINDEVDKIKSNLINISLKREFHESIVITKEAIPFVDEIVKYFRDEGLKVIFIEDFRKEGSVILEFDWK